MNNLVTPLITSWMVSTTERKLKLDNNSDSSLRVSFLGFYGNFLSDENKKYKSVEVKFLGVKDSLYFSEHSGQDADRIDNYDWDAIPEFRDASGSLANHEEMFNKAWSESRNCPNPSIFEVKNSSWVKECGEIELKHYIVMGGDYNLEVLAEECITEK